MAAFAAEKTDTLAQLVLEALARREQAGRAPQRILEPGHRTWASFRGNLREHHFLGLLAEDAATRFPLPCDPTAVIGAGANPFTKLRTATVYGWLTSLDDVLAADTATVLARWAKALGLPSRFAGADLHKIQADKRVLELPGTGGQLMMRALEKSPDALLHTNATILTSDWDDRAMAGLTAMEADAPNLDHVRDDPDLEWAGSAKERGRFDLVFGLQPDKGGRFAHDDLATRFPAATIVLV